jgi:hypothetical protein
VSDAAGFRRLCEGVVQLLPLPQEPRLPLVEGGLVDRGIKERVGETVNPIGAAGDGLPELRLARLLSHSLPSHRFVPQVPEVPFLLGGECDEAEHANQVGEDVVFAERHGTTRGGVAAVVHMALLALPGERPAAGRTDDHAPKKHLVLHDGGVEPTVADGPRPVEDPFCDERLVHALEHLAGAVDPDDADIERVV